MTTFEIPGEPIGKERPRVTRGGTYTPKRTADYEALVAHYASQALTEPLTGPVHVRLLATFQVRKSWPRKKRDALIWRPHTQTPDLDNIAKAITDAMNGIAYEDDSQVASMECDKVWGDKSSVMVTVRRRK